MDVQIVKMRPTEPGRRRLRFFKPRASPALSDAGTRSTSFCCSECDTVLFERVDEASVRCLRVRCPHCGAISIV